MPNRNKAEETTLKYIHQLDPSGQNEALYKDMFQRMSDNDFEEWIEDLKSGKFSISLVAPNGDKKVKLSLERNRKLAGKLGVPIFERITIKDDDGAEYTPPFKFNILRLPVRRSSQHVSKGISYAEDSQTRNVLTGQVTGKSSGGSLTLPEVYVLNGLGLSETLDELMNVRGGDVSASMALTTSILNHGEVSTKQLDFFRSKAQSTKTLKAIFKAQHIDINI